MSGPQNPMSQREPGARGLLLDTIDRYAGQVEAEGLMLQPEGLPPVKKSGTAPTARTCWPR